MKKMYTLVSCLSLFLFTNNLSAQYCSIGSTSSYEYINNFSTSGGAGSNISNLNSGYAPGGYQNATNMVVAQYAGGPNVSFSVDLEGGTQGFALWVDWNNNMTFNNSEKMFTSTSYGSNFTGSFAVPAGTPVGTYRMRIVSDYDDSTPGACTITYGEGEAEDYTFEVVPVPSCISVTNLATTSLTATSAAISWTAGGAETSWNVEYGPGGFTPGTGTSATVATTSFSVNALTADTHYDFYVQADCGGGDESYWSGPYSIFTGYCQVSGTDSYYYINNFSTSGGGTSNISNLNSGYSGYQNASNLVVNQFAGGPQIQFTVESGDNYSFGFAIWVDWDNSLTFEPGEQVFYDPGYEDTYSGSFGVPAGTPVGTYRMRIMGDFYNYNPSDPCSLSSSYGDGEVEDYSVEVIPTPSCLPVTDLMTSGETANSIDLTWTAGGTETQWNIEWGMPGFTPGTGTASGTDQVAAAMTTVNGLNPGMDYDIYVQADCGGGDESFWTLVQGVTACGPISNLPWMEDFETVSGLGSYNTYPSTYQHCWSASEEEWFTTKEEADDLYPQPQAHSGNKYMAIYSGNSDTLWTPEFQLTAGQRYEFKFWFAGDNSGEAGWSGKVLVRDNQTMTATALSGGTFVTSTEVIDDDFRQHTSCFTPTVSGIYKFGMQISSTYDPYNLEIDDVSLIERTNSAGTDGMLNVCQTGGLVDLNDIITKDDIYGSWSFALNTSAVMNDTLFDPSATPAGTFHVDYITTGCLQDTASAIITIYEPSSAGTDGNATVCKNEPMNLLEGLSGNADLGGNWYDPQHAALASSQIMAPNFPGQYNYDYVTGNGVCPDDTSNVVVTVTTCDWLSVSEEALDQVSLYPNPSAGMVFIESGLDGTFNLQVLDVNGRMVETGSNSVVSGTNTINLSKVEKGIYFFKLSGEHAEKVFRVVIR